MSDLLTNEQKKTIEIANEHIKNAEVTLKKAEREQQVMLCHVT